MITANASAAIEWLFEKSVRDNSVLGPEDSCAVTAVVRSDPAENARRHLVVLSISSYAFRIVALFDFGTDAATLAYFAKVARDPGKTLEGQALLDSYGEFVNMICGAVNRGLHTAFRHAGMSTPFVLESTCARYVALLKPAQVKSFAVVVNAAVRFTLTVCICADDESPLDFRVDREEAEEAGHGELELF